MGILHLILSTLSNYGRQCAFAIAPIPAYLPQYWTLCNTNDPLLQRRKQLLQPKSATNSPTKLSPLLKKNENSNSNSNSSVIIANAMNSNNFEGGSGTGTTIMTTRGGNTGNAPVTEGGFSSTSIMILLLSHSFRLQYFFVCAILSTFYGYGDNGVGKRKVDQIHFDLVMQSLVMIGIQLLLLSAVTRRKRMAHKKKVDDYDSEDHDHEQQRLSSPHHNSSKSTSLSQKPFIWVYKPSQHWRWDTVHQHVELLILILLVEYVICRYCIYPNNTIEYTQTIKNISILLESCLALPQMILNYRRKSTSGLSSLMVIGWVLGDLLKLVYFIMAYNKGAAGGTTEDVIASNSGNGVAMPHHHESSDMVTFMVGCLFALGLDSIVVLQLVKWYPTKQVKSFTKKMKRSLFLPRSIHEENRSGKKNNRRLSLDETMM